MIYINQQKFLIEQKDFRIYPPECVKDKNGNLIWIQICEEKVDGRWEGFVSLPSEKRLKKLYGNVRLNA